MYDPKKHHRHSIRLQGYDYAQSCICFITINTENGCMMFGDIAEGEMNLNDTGKIVQDTWHQIPIHFPTATTDEFIIMPNHIHGIIMINRTVEEGGETPPLHPPTIGQMVGYFKYQSAKKINEMRKYGIKKIWQRNYYEHLIRDETALNQIRHYIKNNPLNWKSQ